jgi:hypothetical protein
MIGKGVTMESEVQKRRVDDFERSGVVFRGYRSSAKTEVCGC